MVLATFCVNLGYQCHEQHSHSGYELTCIESNHVDLRLTPGNINITLKDSPLVVSDGAHATFSRFSEFGCRRVQPVQ